MKRRLARILVLAVALLPCSALDALSADPDPNGVLRKPIPNKVVVLTFDDGPESSFSVVAPILKKYGFGGSFYICDFDSFQTRKDWYLTWRQMKAMADDGFEIGNHTVGHAGGSAIGGFLGMEDQLLANGVPKPTTIAWPVFQVNTNTYPDLVTNGYTFGRGGHFRSYRPTVDNPFDIPCLGGGTIEKFVKSVRQATGGRIVTICFHGVPDIEHAACSLEPAVFKVMMQYLKDNNYKVIALRDLAEYIDPAKAAKLPPTVPNVKLPDPSALAKEDVPPGATPVIAKPSNDTANVKKPRLSAAKEILTFVLPEPISATIAGTSISVQVSQATDVTALAPTFTLSPLATSVPASGTAQNFTRPQTYTITAQDGSSRVYTVTAVKISQPSTFTWSKGEAGNWSDGSKWKNHLATGSAPTAAGQADYVLNFNQPGNYAATNNLNEDFVLNQLNFSGPSVKVEGKRLAFTANAATAAPPRINHVSGEATVNAPVRLANDVMVGVARNGHVALHGLVSGTGSLIKSGEGQLRVSNVRNTFSGGTVINSGSIYLYVANEGLGTGPITLNNGASLDLEHVNGSNPLILNGGTIHAGNGFGDSWSGAITVSGNTDITSYADFVLSGAMSGPGGITHIGGLGAFGPSNSGTITLTGTNTYTGATVVRRGILRVLKAASLYNADPAQWTPAKISVHPAATLVLSVGGPGEITGLQVGSLLTNLTAAIHDNGLMARAVLCINTANAKEPVVISANMSDSKGAGGGAFLIRKCGTGTMLLTGTNSYTGQTILEGGALSVSSLNSVVHGKASSSLGAPTDIETGEIVIGHGDGECALVYTGTGETSDRVMNLAGKTSTVTFDQSGTGVLKLTSTFVISGYGANKTIALKGDTAGTGEIAGNIVNPYDRAGKATTAVTKSGAGTWTLSGTNRYTGATKVEKGTLSIATLRSLGDKTDVHISEGGTLALNFQGELHIGKLYLDGKLQPAGTYSEANAPKYIRGTGVLKN